VPIHVVADSSAKLAGVRAVLERKFAVTSELLGGIGVQRSDVCALVVKADLRTVENIAALKKLFGALNNVRKRIFLVDETAHLSVSQAYALGASCVLVGALNHAKLLTELADQPPADAPSGDPRDAQATASAGEIALASMFTAVASGTQIDVAGAKNAGSRIAACIDELGLSKWLATVRDHHEGTYQHCLLVTGIAIDFGLSLGVPKRDLERLYSAAMFHDVGKATIPLAVLDKPGRLDDKERALIETHPGAGYDVLKDNKGISAEVLDAVLHHHEYLDGSGYPDKLCAESIPDIVRMLTISDIFAALIEHRHYKSPMSRPAAYDILCGMHGKLEKPLVAAFKEVALNR
jgi:HD-GYP domain-containing protein (c-di-GMP phosphodiesterase class II)